MSEQGCLVKITNYGRSVIQRDVRRAEIYDLSRNAGLIRIIIMIIIMADQLSV